MLSKVIDTLIQMTVVLALYVPIIVGARWWGARKMRKALGAPFDASKCFCGKWRMPSALGIENDLPVRAETVDATDTRHRCRPLDRRANDQRRGTRGGVRVSEFTWERPAATSAPPCPHESVVYVRAGETGGDPDALRGSLIVGDAAAIDACGAIPPTTSRGAVRAGRSV